MRNGASIDICVVTYRNEATIVELLESVGKHLPGARVLICDNSPDELTRHAIDRSTQGVTTEIISSGSNVGFGAGCNLLADASGAEWLMFLNPDARLRGFTVDLTDIPGRALVGAMVTHPSGVLQQSFGPRRTVSSEIAARLLRRRVDEDIPEGGKGVGFVSGAAMLVRRKDFLAVGGFDAARYFMYYEDHDLCRSLEAAGGQILVDPAFDVEHIGAHSARPALLTALARSHDSAVAFYRKWEPRRSHVFTAITILETAIKITASLPRGRIGQTSTTTLVGLLKHQVAVLARNDLEPRSAQIRLDEIPIVVVVHKPDREVIKILAAASACGQVWVVDNTPGGSAVLAELPYEILQPAGSNIGLGAAYNIAAHACLEQGGRWLVLLDQDTLVAPRLLERLADAVRSVSTPVGVIGPRFANSALAAPGWEAIADGPPTVTAVDHVVSSGSLVNLDAWLAVGGFDEDLFIDYVDIDFCIRVRDQGWLVLQCDDVLMRHGMGNSGLNTLLGYRRRTSNYPPDRHYYITRNLLRTLARHGGRHPGWAMSETYRKLKFAILTLLWEPRRIEKLIEMARGARDAVSARRGESLSRRDTETTPVSPG